jgi:hypothetical protein
MEPCVTGFGLLAILMVFYGIFRLIRWGMGGEPPWGTLDLFSSLTAMLLTGFGTAAGGFLSLGLLFQNESSDITFLPSTIVFILCAVLLFLQIKTKQFLKQNDK